MYIYVNILQKTEKPKEKPKEKTKNVAPVAMAPVARPSLVGETSEMRARRIVG